MTTKQQMNAFASWLCAQEGLASELSIGNAREIWRALAIELIGNSERFVDEQTGLIAVSHPFLTAMIDRGLKKSDGPYSKPFAQMRADVVRSVRKRKTARKKR